MTNTIDGLDCSYCGKEISEVIEEEIFEQQFESLKNGNITLFKEWLKESGEGYSFIKWLQGNRLKI